MSELQLVSDSFTHSQNAGLMLSSLRGMISLVKSHARMNQGDGLWGFINKKALQQKATVQRD